MRINTNLNAMTALNQSTKNTALAGNSMEKLSSGLRINKAGDDAAGLAVSEKMRSQIRGMEQADRNVQDGISMAQTAEGALEEAGNIAQRMRELGVQAGNDTLDDTDREKIKNELDQLSEEILKISAETKFNGTSLLDNANEFTVQAGANGETRTITTVNLANIMIGVTDSTIDPDTAEVNAGANGVELGDSDDARAFIIAMDTVIDSINDSRSSLGAVQNRLEATSSNLTTSTENLTAAESRIRDVDIASEMMNLSKLNLLTQASQAMMSQAKSQPEGVMQLLR